MNVDLTLKQLGILTVWIDQEGISRYRLQLDMKRNSIGKMYCELSLEEDNSDHQRYQDFIYALKAD